MTRDSVYCSQKASVILSCTLKLCKPYFEALCLVRVNCWWHSPVQSFLVSGPAGLMTFFCLTTLGVMQLLLKQCCIDRKITDIIYNDLHDRIQQNMNNTRCCVVTFTTFYKQKCNVSVSYSGLNRKQLQILWTLVHILVTLLICTVVAVKAMCKYCGIIFMWFENSFPILCFLITPVNINFLILLIFIL
jgi:hypothetical protein